MKLREKLVRQYLPLWAKETVFYENKRLTQRVETLEQENRELKAFINGIRLAMEHVCKPTQEGE